MGLEPKKPKERKVPRNLSVDTWTEIQAQWEAGTPGAELARKYGVTPSSISHKATKDGWIRGSTIRTKAIEEAREEVKEKLKESYKELVEKANAEHMKMAGYGAQFGAVLFQELQLNVKALQKKRKDQGHTDENPVYVGEFSKCNSQYNILWETWERVARFKRDILRLQEHNSWMTEEENQDALQRLNEIFDEGRKRYEEGNLDVDAQAQATDEAVHSDHPAK